MQKGLCPVTVKLKNLRLRLVEDPESGFGRKVQFLLMLILVQTKVSMGSQKGALVHHKSDFREKSQPG